MRKNYRSIAYLLTAALVLTAVPFHADALSKPKLNKKKLIMKIGQKKKLIVKNKKAAQVKNVRFTVKKKKIARVNKKGVVTALKKGSTKLICKVTLKNKRTYKLRCRITVKAKTSADTSTVPEASAVIVVSGSPAVSATASVKPGALSITPAASGSPAASKAPADTTKPDNTPAASKAPADTAKPDNTPATTTPPNNTDIPDTTSTPASSQAPHLSANGVMTSDNGVMRNGIDAYDIVKEMGAGTNLGNTLEACGTWINSSNTSNYETAWGQPVTTQEMIDSMKAAGFDSLRIPVAWSNMMANDGTYTINEKYFNRVETVLNYALNADMYVIINIHFDSGWWARFGSKTEQERKDAMTKYKTMWTQIANRFKEYSDRLIFESANEELGTRLNSTDDYKGSGYYAKDDLDSLYKLTNEINQTFVDVVRSTGGNNARRFLLIAGYDTNISKTCDLRYKMPSDTIDSHLMVSIHYYSPATYCIADNPNNSWGYKESWGTDEDIKTLQSELSQMRISFINKGYPVIIGEYGVTDTKISENNFVRKKGRDLFFRTVCEYALDNNMCPVLWDCSQVFDRRSLTITNEAEKTLYTEMNEKAHNSKLVKPSISYDSYHWTGTVANSNWNASSASASDPNSTFTISTTGGCFTISGIDWSGFKNPVLKLTCKESSGSALLRLANQVDTSNQYWHHLYDNGTGVICEKTISSGSTISINIPTDDMTSTQNLYFALGNSVDFNGTVQIEIVEK